MNAETRPEPDPLWTRAPERGSRGWLRFGLWVYRVLGRRCVYVLLYPVAAYFFLVDGAARRASRQYLRRLYETREGAISLGRAPTAGDSFRHMLSFARSLYDRVSVGLGGEDLYEFRYSGDEHLRKLVETRRGAILLGSHLGSFDMLRVLARRHRVTINIVMFTRNAARIQSVLRAIDPRVDLHVINMDGGSLSSTFEIRKRLQRGELVGILGDRVPPHGARAAEPARFLGHDAEFARGPFEIATLLGVPILMTTGVRVGPATYEVTAAPLYGGERIPRRERADRISALVSDYAAWLEAWCKREPLQWFNFYDFWGGA
ncbi:MAG: hypothetical protein HKP27_12115 [Myxococcales bacterium]|nr:hypothetical protein [Myxococcales bacterium]